MSLTSVYIIDYGSGNLRSVQKALQHVGVHAEIGSSPLALRRAAAFVLPGVGAFGAAMAELERRGLTDAIQAQVAGGVPLLGVCLGLQLLFEQSEESPGVEGLGLLAGSVRRLPPAGGKIPHIGWNQIEIAKPSVLLSGVPNGSAFYFVHSYAALPRQPSDVLTFTEYGVSFVSGVERDNVAAFQFHPEKSSTAGLRIYRNFAQWAGIL